LRHELAAACARNGLNLRLAPQALCADNAAMIGVLAERKLSLRAEETVLDGDIRPNWELGAV
jgi:N6-L-threonylcarbamoyladenine synthase